MKTNYLKSFNLTETKYGEFYLDRNFIDLDLVISLDPNKLEDYKFEKMYEKYDMYQIQCGYVSEDNIEVDDDVILELYEEIIQDIENELLELMEVEND